jgi:hypothetical protein
MPSDTSNPITDFLSAHQKPMTMQEQRRLKEVLRKREAYAKKKQLNWGNNYDARDDDTDTRTNGLLGRSPDADRTDADQP